MLELELVTNKKKITISLINQMEISSRLDIARAVLNKSIYGYVVTAKGVFYLLKGVTDYKKLKKFIPEKVVNATGLKNYQMVSKCGKYNKFFSTEQGLDNWIADYNEIARLGSTHIYL